MARDRRGRPIMARQSLRFARGAVVYDCENPSVVNVAAEVYGSRCAALVCADGRPVVAVQRLLACLGDDGCQLRYHGDFDWPGVEMAADAIRRVATPFAA